MATLPEGFKLVEETNADLDEAMHVLSAAYGADELWLGLFKGTDPKEEHPWVMKYLAPRWAAPDITLYNIIEISSGRIAGWTALQFPWKYVPKMIPEYKALALSHDFPPLLENMNPLAVDAFFGMLGSAGIWGYDPENDYHRKGTMIHPDFQYRRFGTILTRHCNAISNKSGDRTFVPAREKSVKMFRDNGFVDVGTVDGDVARWGGNPEFNTTWFLKRDPVLN